jgi:hypothetical protein
MLWLPRNPPGAAVAKLAYAAGLKSAGDFPVVGSSPTSRTISETALRLHKAVDRHPQFFAVQFWLLFGRLGIQWFLAGGSIQWLDQYNG